MKKVIDGVAYNTETATPLARKEENYTVPEIRNISTIFETRGGALFEYRQHFPAGDEMIEHMRPISRAGLKKCLSKGWTLLPGATAAEPEASTSLLLRIPASLKARLDEAAASEGQSANTWAMRCIERCLGDQPGDLIDGHRVHIETWFPKGTWRVEIDGVVRGGIRYWGGVWNFLDNKGNDLGRNVAKLADAPKLAVELWGKSETKRLG